MVYTIDVKEFEYVLAPNKHKKKKAPPKIKSLPTIFLPKVSYNPPNKKARNRNKIG